MMHMPKREESQGLVEYALLLVLIAVVVLVILAVLGSHVVLAYARATGGIKGDFLDTAAGDNAVIVAFEENISHSSASCNGSVSNVVFVVVDANGSPITNQVVSASLMVNGINAGTLSGSASSTGIAYDSDSHFVGGSCPLRITAQ